MTEAGRTRWLPDVDRAVVLTFVVFLLTPEVRRLLAGSELKWVYLLLVSIGIGYLGLALSRILATAVARTLSRVEVRPPWQRVAAAAAPPSHLHQNKSTPPDSVGRVGFERRFRRFIGSRSL